MEGNAPRRILLVDDDRFMLHIMGEFLRESGCELETASSGCEALEKCLLSSPDLIVLDALMPGIDGFETCRRLRENEMTRSVPILMATSLLKADYSRDMPPCDADEFISKPFDMEEFKRRVESLLEKRSR